MRFERGATFDFSTIAGEAQANPVQTGPPPGVYSNKQFGFHYTPPGGMVDHTESSKRQIQKQATASEGIHVLSLLLAISSEPDNDANWASVTIETYPRSAFSEPNDAKAEAQMNAWVAHSKDVNALPKSALTSGQSFTVSVFGRREGSVRKGAVIFTTTRRGKLLSFAFATNSPERLKALTETMKTVQFY